MSTGLIKHSSRRDFIIILATSWIVDFRNHTGFIGCEATNSLSEIGLLLHIYGITIPITDINNIVIVLIPLCDQLVIWGMIYKLDSRSFTALFLVHNIDRLWTILCCLTVFAWRQQSTHPTSSFVQLQLILQLARLLQNWIKLLPLHLFGNMNFHVGMWLSKHINLVINLFVISIVTTKLLTLWVLINITCNSSSHGSVVGVWPWLVDCKLVLGLGYVVAGGVWLKQRILSIICLKSRFIIELLMQRYCHIIQFFILRLLLIKQTVFLLILRSIYLFHTLSSLLRILVDFGHFIICIFFFVLDVIILFRYY